MKMMTATMTQTTMAVEAGMMMLSSRLLSPTPSVLISRHWGKGTFDGVISTLKQILWNFTSPKISLSFLMDWLKSGMEPPQGWLHRQRCTRCQAHSWSWTRAHWVPGVALAWTGAYQTAWEGRRDVVSSKSLTKDKQTCRWRENQGYLLFPIPTWSLLSSSPAHFNLSTL